MRINNPKSFIGSLNNPEYDLVTTKKLNNINDTLDNKIDTTKSALSSAIDDTNDNLVAQIESVISGYEERLTGNKKPLGQYGYAFLTSDGKIDPSLIPQLAISQTRVVYTTDLFDGGVVPEVDALNYEHMLSSNVFENYFVKKEQEALAGNDDGFFVQRGDIFVVGLLSGQTPNPVIHGTYIVTKAVADELSGEIDSTTYIPNVSNYDVQRLSYDNGNIIRINGKTLDRTDDPGSLTLYLSEILAMGDNATFTGLTDNELTKLATDLFRVGSDDSGRFTFKAGGKGSEAVTYAKLSELQDLTSNVNSLSGKFESEVERIDAALDQISGTQIPELRTFVVDTVSGSLYEQISNETAARISNDTVISSYVGNDTDVIPHSSNGNLTQKVKQLRYELDNRSLALSGTFASVYELSNKVRYLADNSVLLKYEPLDWSRAEIENVENDEFSGLKKYTYSYSPTYNTTAGFLGPNTNQNNAERIVAIYDNNEQIVYPDITVDKATGTTNIIVTTVDDSLLNAPWTLLVAKPIDKTVIGLQHQYGTFTTNDNSIEVREQTIESNLTNI